MRFDGSDGQSDDETQKTSFKKKLWSEKYDGNMVFFLSSLSEEYNQRLVGSEWKDSGTSPFVATRASTIHQTPIKRSSNITTTTTILTLTLTLIIIIIIIIILNSQYEMSH